MPKIYLLQVCLHEYMYYIYFFYFKIIGQEAKANKELRHVCPKEISSVLSPGPDSLWCSSNDPGCPCVFVCLQVQGTRWSRRWRCWSSTESSPDTSFSSASSPHLTVTQHRRQAAANFLWFTRQLWHRVPNPPQVTPLPVGMAAAASGQDTSWYRHCCFKSAPQAAEVLLISWFKAASDF